VGAGIPSPGGEGQGEGEREFYEVKLATCPSQFLIGTQQVAWLHFTAISNQSSEFVPLLLDNTVGRQPDGSEVRNFAPQAGRVVVVGAEPLLEAVLSTNREAQLILYAPPGTTVRLETMTSLSSSIPWTFWHDVTLTGLSTNLTPVPSNGQTLFIRGRRL
jgi:hypothetical protein